jgi:hypothetical protein
MEENILIDVQEIAYVIRIIDRKYECSVCGMNEWCGTDGCPMDPQ